MCHPPGTKLALLVDHSPHSALVVRNLLLYKSHSKLVQAQQRTSDSSVGKLRTRTRSMFAGNDFFQCLLFSHVRTCCGMLAVVHLSKQEPMSHSRTNKPLGTCAEIAMLFTKFLKSRMPQVKFPMLTMLAMLAEQPSRPG